jgi:hypothetical protein
VFTFVSVHCFFVFLGTSRSIIVFHLVLLRTGHGVDKVIFTGSILARYFLNYHFALVFLLCLSFDKSVGLFIFPEKFNLEFFVVHDFVAIGAEF